MDNNFSFENSGSSMEEVTYEEILWALDELIMDGLVVVSLDENGEERYALTRLGYHKAVQELYKSTGRNN